MRRQGGTVVFEEGDAGWTVGLMGYTLEPGARGGGTIAWRCGCRAYKRRTQGGSECPECGTMEFDWNEDEGWYLCNDCGHGFGMPDQADGALIYYERCFKPSRCYAGGKVKELIGGINEA